MQEATSPEYYYGCAKSIQRRFDFSSCSDLGLGKGLQIQQKHGFHQESDRKKTTLTTTKTKGRKCQSRCFPWIAAYSSFAMKWMSYNAMSF